MLSSFNKYHEKLQPLYDTLKIAAMLATVHLIVRLGQGVGIMYAEVSRQTKIMEQIRDTIIFYNYTRNGERK